VLASALASRPGPLRCGRPEEGGEGFQLVAGERRWRACGEAGLDSIPAIVRALDDEQILEIQWVENLHWTK